MTFTTHPGSLHGAINDAYASLHDRKVADALWTRRLDLWSADPSVQEKVANRLGWLDAIATIDPQLPRLRTCSASFRNSGITDIVLLGMGGSSLAPEVLRAVIGVASGFPRFTVLDSVDPDAVRAAMARPESSLFVIASKSGSTIAATRSDASRSHLGWSRSVSGSSSSWRRAPAKRARVLPRLSENPALSLSNDRAVVRVTLDDAASEVADAAFDAGLPVMTLAMPNVLGLGAEFFRWEVGTAVAGLLLDINPFDEPNVAAGQVLNTRAARRLHYDTTPAASRTRCDGRGHHAHTE